MFKTIRYKLRFDLVFVFLMTLIVLPFIYSVGPVIERNLNPVVTRAKIIRVETPLNPLEDDWLKFWVTAEKLRQCNLDHLEWFSGDPEGAYARLTLEFQDPVHKINKAGDKIEHGPLKVYINESQLRNNTFAIMHHRCHPFWLSQSIFYP